MSWWNADIQGSAREPAEDWLDQALEAVLEREQNWHPDTIITSRRIYIRTRSYLTNLPEVRGQNYAILAPGSGL